MSLINGENPIIMNENLSLTLRDNAKQQLAQIKDIETGMEYLNKVKAIEVWAKAEKKDAELQNIIAEQKLRTQRIIGKILHESDMYGGDRKSEGFKSSSDSSILKKNDISPDQSSTFQKIASLPEDIFEKEIAHGKAKELTTSGMLQVAKSYERQERNEIKKSISLPVGIFNIIYCDPPWKYDFAETDSRKIENQYPTMAVDEICEMPLPEISEDALLLMWATAPKLLEALTVIDAWGFSYKTHAAWDKEKFGMGYWFRGQHELLLVATKGSFSPPPPEYRYSSIYKEARQGHSLKPEFYYEWIEKSFQGNKIELFARNKRHGWEAWGNELS